MKNIKKIFAVLIAISMFWGMWSSTYAYDGRTANQADGFTNENMPIAYTNYGHNYYAFASSGGSYLVKTSSGYMTILGNSTEDQASMSTDATDFGNTIFVEYYDSSFNRTSYRYITLDLPIFGAFYETSTSYYIVSGQENPNENSTIDCYGVTRYDKNWNKISYCGMKDCNTTEPFSASNCCVEGDDSRLLIRTSHRRYEDEDGLNHQVSITLEYYPNANYFEEYVSYNEYGYASHCFAQYIIEDGGKEYSVIHGDAYPRSVELMVHDTSWTSEYEVLQIPGRIGNNNTYTSLGGFALSSTTAIVAGSTVYNSTYRAINESVDARETERNIYVATVDRESHSTSFRKLTNYTDCSASTPYLIDIGNNQYLLMWNRIHDYENEKTVYCQIIDGRGNDVGGVRTFEGYLSDCTPVLDNGKLVWFAVEGHERHLYTLTLSNFSINEKVYGAGTNFESMSGSVPRDVYAGMTYDVETIVSPSTAIPATWWLKPYEVGYGTVYTINENNQIEIIGEGRGQVWFYYSMSSGSVGTTFSFTAHGNVNIGNFVERLYTVALERNSDTTGKEYWIKQIIYVGQSGGDVARGFLYSDEFLGKNVSNEAFVETLYRVFFDRPSDPAGLQYWVNRLNSGDSKQTVIEGFINSSEWATLCFDYGIASGGNGVVNTNRQPTQQIINFSTRLYTTCLGRSADEVGLMDWATRLVNRQISGSEAAHGFFFSTEFMSDPNINNSEYITRLYRTFMDREPDPNGFNDWMQRMESGATREDVFNGFAGSQEWAGICASYGILK